MSVSRMISSGRCMRKSPLAKVSLSATRFASTYKPSPFQNIIDETAREDKFLFLNSKRFDNRALKKDDVIMDQYKTLVDPFHLKAKNDITNDKNDKEPSNKEKVPSTEEENNDQSIEKETDIEHENGDRKSVNENSSKFSPLSASDASIAGAAAPPNNNNNNNNGDNGDDEEVLLTPPKQADKVPGKEEDVYPSLLAIPLDRPLVPNFFRAITITNPEVIKAVYRTLNDKIPYIGCFYMKDQTSDSDVIYSPDDVHPVGVLAQITNTFSATRTTGDHSALTLSVYPHKVVTLDKLHTPKDEETSKNESDSITANDAEKVEESLEVTAKTDLVKEENAQGQEVISILKGLKVSLADTSDFKLQPYDLNSPKIAALTSQLLETCKELSGINSSFKNCVAEYSKIYPKMFETPLLLVHLALAAGYGRSEDLQDIMASTSLEFKLEGALTSLKKDIIKAQFQKKMEADLQARATKKHREYDLMENLKSIKKELGVDDGRDKLIDLFNQRVAKLTLPAAAEQVFKDEMARFQTLEPASSEFGVVKNYLDWITQIPWGIYTKDQFDISKAIEVLNTDHYGLKDTKERILEFISVGKLLGKVDGKIICLVGPPGVGKTSIAKSIARSLEREFFRFSVGGLSDVSEIKGHRRTYVGALPGRIVTALKKSKSSNPLILIDEIDKIPSRGTTQGDPSAALLEVLDPEQNNAFLDQYLDIPVDLSKVLFICTANTLSTIPGPLLDRMEIIELSGYVEEEKIKIAENYLSPEEKKKSGLEEVNVTIKQSAIQALIRNYCRESGVRNLKKQISKIYRKAAYTIVKDLTLESKEISMEKSAKEIKESHEASEFEDKAAAEKEAAAKLSVSSDPLAEKSSDKIETTVESNALEKLKIPDTVNIEIGPEDLKKYIGPAIFTKDRLYDITPPGVVMGLAWTTMGGTALYIESIYEQPLTYDSVPKIEITGQLGDVMKESSRIAFNYTKMFLGKNYPENRFFDRAKIHLHCPEGATPKDGPSAGITMASSLISLALNRPLSPSIAMTGELTLTGKVLKIGGLKEKCIAAKRSGCTHVIFPKENLADWEAFEDNVKEGLEILPVDWYPEVFNKLFPDISAEQANNVWRKEFDQMKEIQKKEREELKA